MNNHQYGMQGETLAKDYVEKQGFSVIEQNFRYGRYGEIDIIGIKDTLLVFFEVKTRHTLSYGNPSYAITNKKKKALRAVATYFLIQNPHYNSNQYTLRFDCITILGQTIEWIQDIVR
ncbi:MAG TPA: YraN family protein [Spirochaetota bacterium]|nr:YraN family protein [Spirochaetota bacterium]HOM09638.1 YraN family protein [Spirochaetota bacterium]HPP50591.1 YraN family protein [Spirochaetota bacterium]